MYTPFVLTLFGIAGHLSRTELLPALFELYHKNALPKTFHIIGFGRRPWSENEFTEFVTTSLSEADVTEQKKINDFLQHCSYLQGNLDAPESFEALRKRVTEVLSTPTDVLVHYFAIAPEYFGSTAQALKSAGLATPNARIMIEKPFGHDLESAEALQQTLTQAFDEEQIYRVDHYLGKTTVRALPLFRRNHQLDNGLFGTKKINRIEIVLAEEEGIDTRAGYYDTSGAVRDMLQSHGLTLLAQLTMPLANPDHQLARARALKSLHATSVITGQYEGYHEEPNIPAESRTETYAQITFTTDLPGWEETTLILTTGKRLKQKLTTATVTCNDGHTRATFTIYPEATIHTMLEAGDKVDHLTPLPFTAYAMLILDCLAGRHENFVHSSEVKAAWTALDSVLTTVETHSPAPYVPHSWGPGIQPIAIK